ncbi:Alpha/Beta hydrolase protein [Kalaharituber pfeilii]|nr:Alpha/Beta hydrolase protein [Kalaharituber pfeilii]
MGLYTLLLAATSAFQLADAQYPPRITNVYEIQSPINPEVLIRFKSPDSRICHTANESQKQYTGYIDSYLASSPNTLAPVQQNYPINTFFWFFEARENAANAPLTIWLNGGPGSSSMIGLFQEMGPCQVVQDRKHLETIPREFGWDRTSNLLFIDQPNQVGFSYDTATNGVLPLLNLNSRFIPNASAPPDGGGHIIINPNDPQSIKFAMEATNLLNGTFSSGNGDHTANTTEIAAQATWHFLQTWFSNFPQYYPNDSGLQLMAESYGGKYGPSFCAYIEEQNARLRNGTHSGSIKELHLRSLGIVNGCIDDLVQTPYYAIYGNHNPYNITAISDSARARALDNFFKPGGCRDKVLECRQIQRSEDPRDVGDSELVNHICRNADKYCSHTQMNPYFAAGRGVYDIAHADPDPFPPSFYLEYLNNATVQSFIGVPINYTQSSSYVYKAFSQTGDMPRGGELDDIAYLLERGVRVALIYGDRDYICNYMGGQAVSLAIKYSHSAEFAAAGYEDVQVNSTFVGGQVRQYGNFSFTRVYQAGHLVPAYQPETAFTIFDRLIHGKSLATGENINTSGNNIYSTRGKNYTDTGLIPPPPPAPVCYVRAVNSCTKEKFAMLAAGQGVIINGVLYNSHKDYNSPEDTSEERESGDDQDTSTVPDNMDPQLTEDKDVVTEIDNGTDHYKHEISEDEQGKEAGNENENKNENGAFTIHGDKGTEDEEANDKTENDSRGQSEDGDGGVSEQ